VVSDAGAVTLFETVRATGLDRALSGSLASWRRPLARHDPGKIICEWAIGSRSVGTVRVWAAICLAVLA
jgi:hypothetical protein